MHENMNQGRKNLSHPQLQILYQRMSADTGKSNQTQLNSMKNHHKVITVYNKYWKMLRKQMTKDRNNLFSLLLSLNYSSSINTHSIPQNKNDDDDDYNSNPRSTCSSKVKSLSDICIDTISKHFDDYDTSMMKDFLDMLLIPDVIEKILLLTCKYRTQNDSNIGNFMLDVVKRVYLSSAITCGDSHYHSHSVNRSIHR